MRRPAVMASTSDRCPRRRRVSPRARAVLAAHPDAHADAHADVARPALLLRFWSIGGFIDGCNACGSCGGLGPLALALASRLDLDGVDLLGEVGWIDPVDPGGQNRELLHIKHSGCQQALPWGGRFVVDPLVAALCSAVVVQPMAFFVSSERMRIAISVGGVALAVM